MLLPVLASVRKHTASPYQTCAIIRTTRSAVDVLPFDLEEQQPVVSAAAQSIARVGQRPAQPRRGRAATPPGPSRSPVYVRAAAPIHPRRGSTLLYAILSHTTAPAQTMRFRQLLRHIIARRTHQLSVARELHAQPVASNRPLLELLEVFFALVHRAELRALTVELDRLI